jgi:hypothetical protein
MRELPDFGTLLTRLAANRNLVIDGEPSEPMVLRRLAPVLGLHTADLFVMAGMEVPDDLAPRDEKAGALLDELVRYAVELPPERRSGVLQYARSLPRSQRTSPPAEPPVYEQYAPSAGAVLVRLLHNRNLHATASVKILCQLAKVGPLSAATMGGIGHGRVELTPQLVAGFATLLAIPGADLAALTGIEPAHGGPPLDPAAPEVAQLIWEVRSLTADQVGQVIDEVKPR